MRVQFMVGSQQQSDNENIEKLYITIVGDDRSVESREATSEDVSAFPAEYDLLLRGINNMVSRDR